MKIYSSDHTTSYPRRLEPHNLELFRIDVTNCLEIFCETCSSMFSVLKLRTNISFHESAYKSSSPHFYQVAIGFLVEQLNGELCAFAKILDLKERFCMLLNFNCRIFLKNLPFFEYMIPFGVQNLMNMCPICETEIKW